MTNSILFIIAALSAFGPLAVDFYLPSFPAMATAFSTDVENIQHSLSSYFIGLAIGQIIYGSLSDRFGRRIPMLVGVGIFTLTSLACALATSLEWLIGLRFLQALGGCAGMVIGRAVTRDLCDPINSAKVFSQLMLIMGAAPMLAPLGGALLLERFGWESIFISLAIFSALCWVAVLVGLPETRDPNEPPAPLSGALRAYGTLLCDKPFMGYVFSGGMALAAKFAYISGSPFVFIQLFGLSPEQYGWLFGINAIGFVIGAQLNARLLNYQSPDYWLIRVVWLFIICTATPLVCLLLMPGNFWPILLSLTLALSALGLLTPNAMVGAMATHGRIAGSASALMGCLQFTLAALASALVATLHDGTAVPMLGVIFGCALLSLAATEVTRRKAAADSQP